ncbi:MAG: hypothetical protein HYU39_07060 [Thaumarchaeota archaeon]|nr:hypothetical protein [Nitrososphaerota archaeon]
MAASSSVRNVVNKVSDEARQEMIAILGEGVKEAESILEAARREAVEAVTKILESKDRQADAVKRRLIGNAELVARNKSLQLTEETVNKVFHQSLDKIARLEFEGSYDDALKRILEESIISLDVKEVVCSCSKRDLKTVSKLASEVGKRKGVKIEMDPQPLNCAGGVKVRSTDGSIVYDNTVEARLARIKPLLRRQVYDLLSGGS